MQPVPGFPGRAFLCPNRTQIYLSALVPPAVSFL